MWAHWRAFAIYIYIYIYIYYFFSNKKNDKKKNQKQNNKTTTEKKDAEEKSESRCDRVLSLIIPQRKEDLWKCQFHSYFRSTARQTPQNLFCSAFRERSKHRVKHPKGKEELWKLNCEPILILENPIFGTTHLKWQNEAHETPIVIMLPGP